MADFDRERRSSPRVSTNFQAVELRGDELHYRIVTNVSEGGFFYEDAVPSGRPGDEVVMEFPVPGRSTPIRIRGEVRFVAPRRGTGVRVTEPGARMDELFAELPLPSDEDV